MLEKGPYSQEKSGKKYVFKGSQEKSFQNVIHGSENAIQSCRMRIRIADFHLIIRVKTSSCIHYSIV